MSSDLPSHSSEESPSFRPVDVPELPLLVDFLRPGLVVSWLWRFVEGWFLSRDYRLLAAGLPVLLLMSIGGGFLWWLKLSDGNQTVSAYETAVAESIRKRDSEATELYLNSLLRLRPHEPRYRFELAMHHLQHGDQSTALMLLNQMTQEDHRGYLPARLWLVQQAGQPSPLIPLTVEQKDRQLRRVLDSEPRNAMACRLMAELCLQKNQPEMAEGYLLRVVEREPQLGLVLANVQRVLKRSAEQIDYHLKTATNIFRERMLADPANVEARLSYAEALVAGEQLSDAERVLKEGISIAASSTHDTPAASEQLQRMRAALGNLYAGSAFQKLSQSVLNLGYAQAALKKAIDLHPENRSFLRQALLLAAMGAEWQPQDFEKSVGWLRSLDDPAQADVLLLADLMAAGGQHSEALALVEPMASTTPVLKQQFVRYLIADGQSERAERLIQELLVTLDSEDSETDGGDSVERHLRQAELLLMTADCEAAIKVIDKIEARLQTDPSESTELKQRVGMISGRARLMLFDQRQKDEAVRGSDGQVALLEEALQSNAVTGAALERLVRLSCSEDSGAERAERSLTNLLASGRASAEIYNLIGTEALKMKDFAKARRYLERALSLNPSSPMVLNNLSLALVRQSDVQAERALELANDALQILPDHPDALSTRAEVFVAMQRWEDARRDLEVSLAQKSGSRNSQMLLATVYDALNEGSLADAVRRRMAEASAVEN